MVQLHLADDVAKGGGAQILNSGDGIFNAIGIELGVGYLEIDHRVYLHGDVVLGDNGLGREVNDLLLQAHPFGNAVDKGYGYMQAGAPGGVEGSQALYNVGVGLGYNFDV